MAMRWRTIFHHGQEVRSGEVDAALPDPIESARDRAARRAAGEYVPTTAATAAALAVMQAAERHHLGVQAAPVRETVVTVDRRPDPIHGLEVATATVEVVCRIFAATEGATTPRIIEALTAEGIEAVEDGAGAVWTKSTTTIAAGLARPV